MNIPTLRKFHNAQSKPPVQRKHLTDEQTASIRQQILQGSQLKLIAIEMGVTYRQVYYIYWRSKYGKTNAS